jgi:cyclophilin family peptidyl-prolyl cis-trans isomerase
MKYIASVILCLSVWSSAPAKPTKILIETDYGKILLKLYDNTPLNSGNMVKRVNEHFYDSLLFHRVIPNFVIQGGDPDSKHAAPGQTLGNGDLPFTIPAEINDVNFHKRGALGVARDTTPDKSGSACQFYIVTGRTWTDAELDSISLKNKRNFTLKQRQVYRMKGGTPKLDGRYTVFGEVVWGMDVAEKIAAMERDANDRPKKDVRIRKMSVYKKKWWQN